MPGAIEQFPHCDQLVLHREGTCRYCDAHPEWQELRALWGINFTGENDDSKIPCPSTRRRPLNSVHAWSGNRPRPPGTEEDDDVGFDLGPTHPDPPVEPPKSVYDRLRENPFKRE
jgi:hypothetical protein